GTVCRRILVTVEARSGIIQVDQNRLAVPNYSEESVSDSSDNRRAQLCSSHDRCARRHHTRRPGIESQSAVMAATADDSDCCCICRGATIHGAGAVMEHTEGVNYPPCRRGKSDLSGQLGISGRNADRRQRRFRREAYVA
ncbi:hypothetical protein OY671_011396, partial [Metschnikowia pulcherrima]